MNYFRGAFSKRNAGKNMTDDIIWSSVPALLIHILGLLIANLFTGYSVNIPFLGNLLMNQIITIDSKDVFYNIQENLFPILVYNLWINVIAVPLGQVSREIVRIRGMDIKSRTFRFSNTWHYILSGEALQFPHLRNTLDIKYRIDNVVVDALTEIHGEPVIYSGILLDFYTNKDLELNTLILVKPGRVIFNELKNEIIEPGQEDIGVEIPSSELIIPASQIKNLNLRYYSFVPNKSEDEIKMTEICKYFKIVDNSTYLWLIMRYSFIFILLSIIACTILTKSIKFVEFALFLVPFLLYFFYSKRRKINFKKASDIIEEIYDNGGYLQGQLIKNIVSNRNKEIL